MAIFIVAAAVLVVPALRSQDVDRILKIVRSIPERAFAEKDSSAVPDTTPSGPTTTGPTASVEAKERAKAFIPVVYLTDGSVIRGRFLTKSLPVETPFGTLNIPIEELMETHFYVKLSPVRREMIAAAIARLGDDDFEERDSATNELEALAPDSIPALRQALTDDDEEIRRRAESLLEAAESSAALLEDELGIPLLDGIDRIRTRHSTIQGVISLKALEVETPYGRLRVPRVELRRVVFRADGAQTANLTIPESASVPGNWLTTRIRVQKGDRLRIDASGQMRTPPYSYSGGPDGYNRTSRTLPPFKILSLVGRIGKSGTPFQVGSKYSQRAPASGVLYLGIVPYRYGSLQGSFRATIRTR